MDWPDWKRAMKGYAQDHKLAISASFNVDTSRCGPQCRTLLEEIQRKAKIHVDGILGPQTQNVLHPFLPSHYFRVEVVHWGRWGVSHNSEIGYAQYRPVRYGSALPKTLDCSTFYINSCYLAGVRPDPSGYHYDGYGNTDSLAANMTRLADISHAFLGDALIWGHPGSTTHVAMVSGNTGTSNPTIITHGSEGQPQEYALSVELPYHHGQPLYAYRLPLHN